VQRGVSCQLTALLKKKKEEEEEKKFGEGMPPGLRVTMNETSAYVTQVVSVEWLRSHFIPRKKQEAFCSN
jgi:hypothetical protein